MDKDYSDRLQRQMACLAEQDATWRISYIEPCWYLLFKKESSDGMESPTYQGRTTDSNVAQKFLDDNKDIPYVSARVDICKDDLMYSRFPGEKV